MNHLSTLFLDNKYLLVLFILITLVAGFSALQSLPRLEDPILTNRNAQILTLFPGATAERVEALITEKIEQELQEIPEIKHLDTTSSSGVSSVAIELEDAVTTENNERIFSEIRDKLADAERQFPAGALAPVFDDKRNAVAFSLILHVAWEDGREEDLGILNRNADLLADRLRQVPGTELVRVYGEVEEEISVNVDPRKTDALGLSFTEIASRLRAADVKAPSGVLRSSQTNLSLQLGGEFDSVQRVQDILLINGIRLGDVAKVERGVRSPPVEMAYTAGKRGVLVAARVLPNQRVDLWNEQAKAAVATFEDEAGGGLIPQVVFEQNTYTSARLSELAGNLGLGALAVFFVVLVTMGWRASLIVATALPLTSALTLFIVALQGGKLHQMSIFGMIIALGLLIDNAIVVTDEVRKGLANGLPHRQAVSDALHHLFLPLLSSTLTTMLAFMPILLLPGGAGDFVSSIGGSVIIALGSSFVVAMTVVASLAGLFGKTDRGTSWFKQGIKGGVFARGTRRFLTFGLRHPLIGMLVALLLPLAGFVLAGTLGSQFFPRTDRNMFEVAVYLPNETSIGHTRRVSDRVDEVLRNHPEVQEVSWLIGGSFPTVYYNLIMNKDSSAFYSQAIVTTDSFESTNTLIDELQAELDEVVPEAQILVKKFAQGPPVDGDVELRLSGPNVRVLQDLGEDVRRRLAEHPGILHTRVSLPRGEPTVNITADEDQIQMAGLDLTQLATQLQLRTEGILGGFVLEGIEDLPVRIRLDARQRDALNDIENFRFRSPVLPGQWIPLAAVAEVRLEPEVGVISRRDGVRINSIQGYAATGTLPITITNDVMNQLKAEGFSPPAGYTLELGGEAEDQSEALGNLTLYLPILIVATIAILVLSFKNVRIAFILLLVAPLSVGVGLLATWAMSFPLSFNTIIGSLGLMGLAFNSSIVVIAAIRANVKASSGNSDAICNAVTGSGRHLVSTTLTTIASFLPLLLLIGGEFWPPLAIVLAGGVGGSTLLAIFFTPLLYKVLFSRKAIS